MSKTKIILIAIVKNEHKIIKRMIDSVKHIIDAICITDTGSSDNTIEIIEKCILDLQIPGKVYRNIWRNFGHNRSLSFKNTIHFCKENNIDTHNTFGLLLDADMELITNNFDKNTLSYNNYNSFNVIQSLNNLEYYNTRLIKLSLDWKCIGVTHEYWECNLQNESNDQNESEEPNKNQSVFLQKEQIYIRDSTDGSSRTEKYKRDISLLENAILKEPDNKRYIFYLAQSYKDTQQYQKAIDFYNLRISLGGWDQEIWYSYYMISVCWKALENFEEFEKSGITAFEYRRSRAEPIYELLKYCRETKNYKRAFHYYTIGKSIEYPKDDILFINRPVYDYLFDYEYTIIHYYLYPENRLDGCINSINFLNTYFDTDKYNNTVEYNTVFLNTKYYMPRLLDFGEKITLNLPVYDNFLPSSVSLLQLYTDRYLANVRYVNYTISSSGPNSPHQYYTNNNEKIQTRNAHIVYDHHFNNYTSLCFMDDSIECNETEIERGETETEETKQKIVKKSSEDKDVYFLGLEDVRLFAQDHLIGYTANTIEYSYNNNIRIIKGLYDPISKTFNNNSVLKPPTETPCEKNWIVHKDKIIYKWYPLEIGSIEHNTDNKLGTNQLIIQERIDTPHIFKYYRGSSNIYEYENNLWTVTHGVYDFPRKYFHQVVVMDKNYVPLKYTIPFYFNTFNIEYCLGFFIRRDTAYFSISQNDRNPIVVKIKFRYLEKLFLVHHYKDKEQVLNVNQ